MATSAVPLEEYQELLACYRRLGVPPDSSADALKKRYRTLAKRWHPDKHARTAPGVARAEEAMKAINVAYRRIKHAPLAEVLRARPSPAPAPTPPNRATSTRRVAWDWEGLARAKGFPSGRWVTKCVCCRRSVTATGIRYVKCRHCGKGFFPDVDDPRSEPAEPWSWQKKLGLAAISALASVLHLESLSPRAELTELALVLVLSFLIVSLPLALARE